MALRPLNRRHAARSVAEAAPRHLRLRQLLPYATLLILVSVAGCDQSSSSPTPTGSSSVSDSESSFKESPQKDPITMKSPDSKETVTHQGPPAGAAPAASAHPGVSTQANHLAGESSPYLLMHAYNPVDWYPWGPEALEKAKREDKLIFLSVGYSSCHWCHVMEQETFRDEEIATLLNEHFVCIKVDREERPDIDRIYMTAVQIAQRGRGGWPMTVFLLPDAKPFLGMTYLPARDGDRPGAPGFLSVISQLRDVWRQDPERVRTAAAALTEMVKTELEQRHTQAVSDAALDGRILNRVQRALSDQFDPQHGGFGYSPQQPLMPKFPEPSNLVFLLHRIESSSTPEQSKAKAREMLLATLDAMAAGGIHDHLGGGFHRYSVDRFWRIPHFEKMLYDNGQLASVYAEAYRLTQREDYARTARGIADFVLSEMTDAKGGFYAALDADSEHVEGKFYRWTSEEVRSLITLDEFELFAKVYGLDGPPNFEEHFHVPMLRESPRETAGQRNLTEKELVDKLAPIRERLLAVRNQRVRPLTDTKIITSWNGLMIRGLADTGRLLDEARYVQAAERAVDFVLTNMKTEDGRLLRTFADGKAKLNAYLTDYAFLIDGLIALHQATGQQRWLDQADQLTQRQIELFADGRGGFYFTSHNHESLLARTGDPRDNVQPSGASVSADNLLYLGQTLNKPDYLDQAERTIRSTMPVGESLPLAIPRMAVVLDKFLAMQSKESQSKVPRSEKPHSKASPSKEPQSEE